VAESDVPAAIQLDAELDELVDPTVSELYRVMHGYDPEAIGAAAAVRGGNGGSQPAGSVIPTANADGVTVDTTTYDDTIAGGGAKLTTLVFPQNQGAIAIAIEGDDFPRYVIAADPDGDGIYIGDGTGDPTDSATGAEIYFSNGELHLAAVDGNNVVIGANFNVAPSGTIDAGGTIQGNGAGGIIATAGPLATLANTEPADGTLFAGEAAIWFDPTNGAAALNIKAKQADGTVKTATIPVVT